MELSYPPFEMTDTQNHPAGVSPDLARALAKTDVPITSSCLCRTSVHVGHGCCH